MIDFTLYPNLNGQLGQNKVQIPDGVTTFWPDGDALVGNFIYKDGKLSGFVDTKALIANDNKTTTIPYDYFNSEFENVRENSVTFNLSDRCKYFTLKLMPKYKGCKTLEDIKAIDENYMENDIVDGVWSKELSDLENSNSLFKDCEYIISFKSDLSSLTDGSGMFHSCSNLTTFTSDLSSLTNGYCMFHSCSNLTTFTSDLSSLTNGYGMFYYCSNLEKFESNLISLVNGNSMFRACPLTTFKCSDLSHLTDGLNMFWMCNMTSFNYDLSSLENGEGMFYCCFNFTSFKSNLKSLTNGTNMFYGCKLDTKSLKNIAETINTVTELQPIHIGIGNTTPSEEENSYLTQIHNKGWQVYVNGITDSNIFNPTSLIPIDGEQNIDPIPFWAKPVSSSQEEANYIDENGNYYNILGGQFIYVNDPETYGMFINEEDAAAQMRLTRIEKEDI
jgi:hypothetical protein